MKPNTIKESLVFLETWGKAFRAEAEASRDEHRRNLAHAYYRACVDAHNGLQDKPFRFHVNRASLRSTLHLIVDHTEKLIKQRQLPANMQIRADFFRQIAAYFEDAAEGLEQGQLFG